MNHVMIYCSYSSKNAPVCIKYPVLPSVSNKKLTFCSNLGKASGFHMCENVKVLLDEDDAPTTKHQAANFTCVF